MSVAKDIEGPLATPTRGKSARKAQPKLAASAARTVVAFPAAAPAARETVPDEILSSQAKDRIADVVKKAASGGRTTIISRGYPIAIIGPVEDVPEAARAEVARLPTTEIKSGQTSLKGIIARNDCAFLTIHGEARAAVYRPTALAGPAPSKVDHLVALLEETRAVEQFAARLHAEIAHALDLLDKIDPDKARSLRARYEALRSGKA
jgi:antitoxin (DNA-binding transcriptional repressor) of toxin-antitoxin stability system